MESEEWMWMQTAKKRKWSAEGAGKVEGKCPGQAERMDKARWKSGSVVEPKWKYAVPNKRNEVMAAMKQLGRCGTAAAALWPGGMLKRLKYGASGILIN